MPPASAVTSVSRLPRNALPEGALNAVPARINTTDSHLFLRGPQLPVQTNCKPSLPKLGPLWSCPASSCRGGSDAAAWKMWRGGRRPAGRGFRGKTCRAETPRTSSNPPQGLGAAGFTEIRLLRLVCLEIVGGRKLISEKKKDLGHSLTFSLASSNPV